MFKSAWDYTSLKAMCKRHDKVCLGLHLIECSLHLFGGLAQLARAPALQAGGQRFESVILHFCKTFYNVCIEFFDILTQARL